MPNIRISDVNRKQALSFLQAILEGLKEGKRITHLILHVHAVIGIIESASALPDDPSTGDNSRSA